MTLMYVMFTITGVIGAAIANDEIEQAKRS